ncbi:uncharacterized protein ACIBXB_013529 isoform 1-T3 [Morphnus guianensis]
MASSLPFLTCTWLRCQWRGAFYCMVSKLFSEVLTFLSGVTVVPSLRRDGPTNNLPRDRTKASQLRESHVHTHLFPTPLSRVAPEGGKGERRWVRAARQPHPSGSRSVPQRDVATCPKRCCDSSGQSRRLHPTAAGPPWIEGDARAPLYGAQTPPTTALSSRWRFRRWQSWCNARHSKPLQGMDGDHILVTLLKMYIYANLELGLALNLLMNRQSFMLLLINLLWRKLFLLQHNMTKLGSIVFHS